MSTEPAPTVQVFVEVERPDGSLGWLHLAFNGDDQQDAAGQAARMVTGSRARRILTFLGPGEVWRISAEKAVAENTRP